VQVESCVCFWEELYAFIVFEEQELSMNERREATDCVRDHGDFEDNVGEWGELCVSSLIESQLSDCLNVVIMILISPSLTRFQDLEDL
jgi:hypothetical protein